MAEGFSAIAIAAHIRSADLVVRIGLLPIAVHDARHQNQPKVSQYFSSDN